MLQGVDGCSASEGTAEVEGARDVSWLVRGESGCWEGESGQEREGQHPERCRTVGRPTAAEPKRQDEGGRESDGLVSAQSLVWLRALQLVGHVFNSARTRRIRRANGKET